METSNIGTISNQPTMTPFAQEDPVEKLFEEGMNIERKPLGRLYSARQLLEKHQDSEKAKTICFDLLNTANIEDPSKATIERLQHAANFLDKNFDDEKPHTTDRQVDIYTYAKSNDLTTSGLYFETITIGCVPNQM